MYCYEENCDELNNTSNLNESLTHPTNAYAWILAIRSILKPAVNQLRGVLPPPMENFDDTGILILIFLVIAIISKLISLFLEDKKHQDVLDRQILHDSITRIKEQDLMIAQLKETASKPPPELEARVMEVTSLRTDIKKLEEDRDKYKFSLETIQKEKEALEQRCEHVKSDFSEKCREMDELKIECQGFKDHNSNLFSMIQDRDKKLEHLEEERKRLCDKIADLEQEMKKLENEKIYTQGKIEDLEQLVKKTEDQNLKLENKLYHEERRLGTKVRGLEELLLKNAATLGSSNNGGGEPLSMNGESSASDGWSDVGDETEQPKKAKSIEKEKENITKEKSSVHMSPERKISIQVDDFSSVMEVATLLTDIRELETDRDKYKFSLETIQKEKEALEQRCEHVKSDLSEKRREMDELKIECQGFKDHNNKLFSMIQDRDKKLEHLEEERERLRDKIADLEQEMKKLENEKRDTQGKIKDLEQLVKKTEDQNLKLENKLYHEERRLGTKVRGLEELLLKNAATLGSSNSGGGEPLMNGGSAARAILGAPLETRSLWSDVEGPEMEFSSQSTNEFRRRNFR